MWSTIASVKDNLNKIVQDVHDVDDDEEYEIYGSVNGGPATPVSDRRSSYGFARSVSRSPLANGVDSPASPEVEQYKSEIKRLRDSEAEIKALSVNYAALLKEKEEQISRMNKENGSLKHNLEVSRNSPNALKGSGDMSSNRHHKNASQAKNRHFGNQISNGVKHDGLSNGSSHAVRSDAFQSKVDPKRDFADSQEEISRSSAEIKQLKMELEKERNQYSKTLVTLQGEQKLNESLQVELKLLRTEKDKTFSEMKKIGDELREKISTVQQLQLELNRREEKDTAGAVENMRRSIATLEKENARLKMEKDELKADLDTSKISNEKGESSASFLGKEEMELSLQKMDREIKETRHERDKAIQQLTRLKQHLLDKESEESEKMDEDSKTIEELREASERQRSQILYLEKALKQAVSSHEEVKTSNSNELQKLRALVDDLNKKLANCTTTINSKNVELLNLQTVLGQYYAEMEAKERLEGDLTRTREELSKLSQLLQNADQKAEESNKEKEEILSKLSQSERIIADWKSRVNKLEEDNAKLRRALEQSMTRLNRMSVDSDFLVDRRIVIKLLVTYFQRNHSKEVLDLMVRMLGFSNEDKERIGGAQQGKSVVRGVLGLPGRFVGGILGGSSGQGAASAAMDNQSFADLWVDFLLKENEERERREAMDSSNAKNEANTSNSVPLIRGNSEQTDTEFSTVPLTSADTSLRSSRFLQKY